MSKFGTFEEYPKDGLMSAQAALLTAWRSLERYHDDLVLVGGLAVHYLTRRDFPGLHAITMDVDFGISLGASGEQYGTIQTDLSGLGFKIEDHRMVRKFGSLNLFIDFLTEAPPATRGTRTVDDILASVFPGINRALESRRNVSVEGKDFYGAMQSCTVAVADIAPLLVLKLNAFGGPQGRRLPKDAYDILLAVSAFIDGPTAAIQAFHAESKMHNSGYTSAIKALKRDFVDPKSDGPIRAAEFMSGSDEERKRICQDLATIGKALLGE